MPEGAEADAIAAASINSSINDRAKVRFAEFAESVELGLASFFVSGQDGLDALLRELQKADGNDDGSDGPNSAEEAFYRKVFHTSPPSRQAPPADECVRKRGVLNLLALLSARFPAPKQKLQLAILFSMISDPHLQPTEQIGELLTEAAADAARKTGLAATAVDVDVLEDIRSNAILLLPPSFRPLLDPATSTYYVPMLPPLPAGGSASPSLSARYRAVDPIFGGLGSIPVTKGAVSLSAGQYSRLALSGAACTVLVRTVLNPLELVKTKTQLGNDPEFTDVVLMRGEPRKPHHENAAVVVGDSRGCSSSANEAEERSAHRESRHSDPMSQQIVSLVDSHQKEIKGPELAIPVHEPPAKSVGTIEMIYGLVKLRGPSALFQSADITFLASIVFGSFGYGATELFRRWFALLVETDSSNTDTGLQLEAALLAAAAFACVAMCAAATPFEVLRVRSMASVEPKGWERVLLEFVVSDARALICFERLFISVMRSRDLTSLFILLHSQEEKRGTSQACATSEADASSATDTGTLAIRDIRVKELSLLWDAFPKVVSRELPFAIVKFIAFDMAASAIISFIDAQTSIGGNVQVGSGAAGLAVSAVAGAVAGIAGAIVSHPADLILTLTSSSAGEGGEGSADAAGGTTNTTDWLPIVQDLISREGGVANLFVGLPTRALFFALVIGLQFWLYDYVKNLLQVGSDDLTLVLDVFYALSKNLIESTS